jgi:hypothetical protein
MHFRTAVYADSHVMPPSQKFPPNCQFSSPTSSPQHATNHTSQEQKQAMSDIREPGRGSGLRLTSSKQFQDEEDFPEPKKKGCPTAVKKVLIIHTQHIHIKNFGRDEKVPSPSRKILIPDVLEAFPDAPSPFSPSIAPTAASSRKVVNRQKIANFHRFCVITLRPRHRTYAGR